MGFIYRYKCKKCGKKYTYLPVICDCCGTTLSFICPMDIWSTYPEYKKSTDCEKIFEFPLPFGKKARISELERKIKKLNGELCLARSELLECRNDIAEMKMKMDLKNDIISSLKRENAELKRLNSQYKALLNQYQSDEINSSLNASQGIISAVKYAMKKSHPDNGGNTEDFVRFKKCYEELTGR